MDEYRQRIILEEDSADDILEAGWEFETEEELNLYVESLRARGVAVTQSNREDCSARCVEKVYWCEDPTGYKHAFYFGPELASATQPFRSKVLCGSGFNTGPLGLGHILTRADDYQASVEFYRTILGLRLSDYIREEREPGFVIDATFLHAKTGRHHSLATASMPGNKRLNHLMVEVNEMDDVGLAYDRCVAAGVPMVQHLGHHPNDRAFSFYVRTPSGFALEFGHGGVVIDDATWKVVNYPKLSDWGHRRSPPVPA